MLFASTVFLFAFLPAVILVYYTVPLQPSRRGRNIALLLFSYVYYLYGAADFLPLLMLSTVVDYGLARRMETDRPRRRLWLVVSLVVNLGLLFYFKYANFFVHEINLIFTRLGLPALAWLDVLLPIGISFFTFQKLSYVIDVYRGEAAALRDPLDFALYVAMFPQLIAGPIVRFQEIRAQLQGRHESWERFYLGITRICWGLAKKVIIAESLRRFADTIFALPPGMLDTKTAWLGAVTYTLQIYFDFSGYSDMAIGLGLLFGFVLPENFKRPYSAISITDFWRRWHISLSRWFRDYLYIPLGGNRRGAARACLNMAVVFVLCGLWHGANWTFLAWGLYHGLFLMFERLSGLRQLPAHRWLVTRRTATLVIVTVGWVLFRAADFGQALGFLSAMFTWRDLPLAYDLSLRFNAWDLTILIGAAMVFLLPADFSGYKVLGESRTPRSWAAALVLIFIVFPVCGLLIVSSPAAPFIYFRF
ncbi:MAG: MBOAT family protein [Desulfobacterales bacterium]|jgi:alginate O-acetyltransferase complex protein AlgI